MGKIVKNLYLVEITNLKCCSYLIVTLSNYYTNTTSNVKFIA